MEAFFKRMLLTIIFALLFFFFEKWWGFENTVLIALIGLWVNDIVKEEK